MLGSTALVRPAESTSLLDWAEDFRIIRRFQSSGIAVRSYSMSSAGMLPTLDEGDVVLADLRAAAALPQRGDMIVFRHGSNVEYIKRVIGRPGDSIEFVDQALVLNGETVTQPDGEDAHFATSRRQQLVSLHIETLPDEVSYEVALAQHPEFAQIANMPVTIVAPGHLFVVGDNRDRSIDSRASQFGSVKFGDVVGRLVYRLRPNPGWLVAPDGIPGFAQE